MPVMAQDAANQSEMERERKMEEGGTLWRDQASDGHGTERAPKGHNSDGSGKEDHGKEVRTKGFSDALLHSFLSLNSIYPASTSLRA